MMYSWFYTIISTFPVHTWSLLSILLLSSSVNGKRMEGLFFGNNGWEVGGVEIVYGNG